MRSVRQLLLLSIATASCTGSIGGPASDDGESGQKRAGAGASAPGPVAPGGISSGSGGARGNGDSTGPGSTGTNGGAGAFPAATPCQTPLSLAPTPLRRLTRTEYDATVRDLLGTTSRPAEAFQDDEAYGGFESNGIAPLSRLLGEQYQAAAEKLANDANLTRLLPCDPASGEDACARMFISRFGRRAYRRPLDPAEGERFFAVFREGRALADFNAGVRLVITAALQSPAFLYRPEVTPPEKPGLATAALSGFELASRLSYFLWSSMPDDELLGLGESGALRTPATLEAQARRLLADPRSVETLRSFARQWLELRGQPDKDPKIYADFTPGLWSSMRAESMRFFEELFRGDRSLATLLTSPHGFVDATLAQVYGVPAPGGAGLTRVELPAAQRSGVLTQAAFLTVQAFPNQGSPIHRGKFVREMLLCQVAPPPPPDLAAMPPGLDPSKPTQQRFEEHRASPMCRTCHELMDPIGYGFQHYDGIGRWQVMDGRFPVDARGEIHATAHSDGPFVGAVELGRKLATSPDVHRCMAQQFVRFALGRPDDAGEACAIDTLHRRFVAANLDLRELMVAVVGSDLFRLRRAP